MKKKYIDLSLSKKILTIGVYYKNNAPGGMASVVSSYDEFFSKFLYISSWRIGGWGVKLFYFYKALLHLVFLMLFNFQIKIVHIHSAAHNSFYRKSLFLKIAKFFKRKVVFHIHASQFKDFYWASNKKQYIVDVLNTCDKVIVLSKSWKDFFIEIGVKEERIVILRNIVSMPAFGDKKFRETTSLLRLLFLGEIGDRKGVFDLLKVLSLNPNQFSERIRVFIGGNGDIDRLKRAIDSNNLGGFVSFVGWVSGNRKKELLQSCNVLVLPSYNEGLPISILEGMSYGLPIISTNVGGIPEIVKDGYNGFLVNPGDLNGIHKAILTFIENPTLLNTLGDNSKKVVGPYLPESVFTDLCDIYISILS